jgi:hypothetical protein
MIEALYKAFAISFTEEVNKRGSVGTKPCTTRMNDPESTPVMKIV